MKTVEEIKTQVEIKLKALESKVRFNDPVYNFLVRDDIGDFIFESHLMMLPYEFVVKYGVRVLEDQSEYEKYRNPQKYDVFRLEWDKHLLGYWNDRLQLLNEYLSPTKDNETAFDIFNRLSDLMTRIERRALLLRPVPQDVKQVHSRQVGEPKKYDFVRSYWLTDTGEKKRMIARNITDRYQRLEKEIANMFIERGFAVHRNYRPAGREMCDMVIELGEMKTAVEIKLLRSDKENTYFKHLFLFDELCKRFEQDYKNTP